MNYRNTLKLYTVEYDLLSNNMSFSCKILCYCPHEIQADLVSQIGQPIKITSIMYMSDVHRICSSIRNNIVQSVFHSQQPVQAKRGRPKIMDFGGL